MVQHILQAVCAVLLLSGCSSTIPVIADDQRPKDEAITVAKMNSRLEGHSVILHLTGGQTWDAKYLRCSADSCFFVRGESSPFESLPVSALECIEHRDYVSGAVAGVLLGTLGGGAAGGLAARLQLGKNPGLGGVFYAAIGGMIGGASGLVTGIVRGWRDEYRVAPHGSAQGKIHTGQERTPSKASE